MGAGHNQPGGTHGLKFRNNFSTNHTMNQSSSSLVATLAASLLLVGAAGAIAAAEARQGGAVFHVAPNGNDQWSGAPAEPNAAKTDGPFATLARARDAVRAWKGQQGGSLKAPVTVFLRGGTYFLKEALALTPQDSGSSGPDP